MKRLANGLLAAGGAIGRGLPTFLRDVGGVAGAALIGYGFYLIAPPYGYIVGGGLLLAGAILSALAPAPK